jgi:hypothetical protein
MINLKLKMCSLYLTADKRIATESLEVSLIYFFLLASGREGEEKNASFRCTLAAAATS